MTSWQQRCDEPAVLMRPAMTRGRFAIGSTDEHCHSEVTVAVRSARDELAVSSAMTNWQFCIDEVCHGRAGSEHCHDDGQRGAFAPVHEGCRIESRAGNLVKPSEVT